MQLGHHLDFSAERLLLDFWTLNDEIINLCCFKPLHLWQLVLVAMESESRMGWPEEGPVYWPLEFSC